jgi:hypothetical protein
LYNRVLHNLRKNLRHGLSSALRPLVLFHLLPAYLASLTISNENHFHLKDKKIIPQPLCSFHIHRKNSQGDH